MPTLADLRTLVRDTLDFTTADLPDSRLDQYFYDSFNQVINMERRWPFLQVSYSLSTVAGQRDYAITAIGVGDLREIASIVDTGSAGWKLAWASYDEMEAYYSGPNNISGQSTNWSTWAANLNLWPKPADVRTLTVRGYRKTSDWIAGGAATSPDCDDRLHRPLAMYALHRVYMEQEDTGMSTFYLDQYHALVENARSEIMRTPAYQPKIYNGGSYSMTERQWLQSIANRGLG